MTPREQLATLYNSLAAAQLAFKAAINNPCDRRLREYLTTVSPFTGLESGIIGYLYDAELDLRAAEEAIFGEEE